MPKSWIRRNEKQPIRSNWTCNSLFMTEELTENRLKEIGIEWPDGDFAIHIQGRNAFAIDRVKKIIYSGIDAYRLFYFRDLSQPAFPLWELDLVPEYVSLRLKSFLEDQRQIAKSLFDEVNTTFEYFEIELSQANNSIAVREKQKKRHSLAFKLYDDEIRRLKHFMNWLIKKRDQLKSQKIAVNDLLNYGETRDSSIDEENNFSLSTIEDWLFPFKEEKLLTDTDYKILKDAYFTYCKSGVFPALNKPIQIRGKVNKKRFGWALHEILNAHSKRVSVEVLEFSQKNISIFSEDKFDRDNYLRSNIYNYHSTKTK